MRSWPGLKICRILWHDARVILALTGYSVLVAFHVIFVVALLGVTFTYPIIGPMAKAQPQHAPFALAAIEKIQRVLVFPGAALVFLTGLWAIAASDHIKGDEGWLTVSIALFIVVFSLAIFVTYPAVKVAKAEAEKKAASGEPGPPSEAFMKATTKMRRLGPFMSLMTLTIVFLMEAKPF